MDNKVEAKINFDS